MRREASYLLKLFQSALCSQKQFEYDAVGFGALLILILDCSLLFLPFRLPEDTLPLFKMFPPLRRLGQVSLLYVGHVRPYASDLRLFCRSGRKQTCELLVALEQEFYPLRVAGKGGLAVAGVHGAVKCQL
jgi:hypothetical protein